MQTGTSVQDRGDASQPSNRGAGGLLSGIPLLRKYQESHIMLSSTLELLAEVEQQIVRRFCIIYRRPSFRFLGCRI